jgi:hypothetical protein
MVNSKAPWGSFKDWLGIKNTPTRFHPEQPGLYHYLHDDNGERSRIHLRIDPDGNGLLLVNANRVIHFNPTAAFMARLALEDTAPLVAVRAIQKRFRVSQPKATDDYTQFTGQLNELIRPDGACPIHDLELEIRPPFSARPSAP